MGLVALCGICLRLTLLARTDYLYYNSRSIKDINQRQRGMIIARLYVPSFTAHDIHTQHSLPRCRCICLCTYIIDSLVYGLAYKLTVGYNMSNPDLQRQIVRAITSLRGIGPAPSPIYIQFVMVTLYLTSRLTGNVLGTSTQQNGAAWEEWQSPA